MVTSEVEWFYPGIGTWKTQQRHWAELTFRLFRFALFCNFGPRPIGTPLSIRIIKEPVREMEAIEMNTPTPAQALGEVIRLREIIHDEPRPTVLDCELYSEAVDKLIDEHGQHFAGLEARLNDAQNAWCVQATELRERAEAAEARCAEAEEMLAWFANNPYAYRIMADKCSEVAAFLAASGERHE